jgi:hypothetical protein
MVLAGSLVKAMKKSSRSSSASDDVALPLLAVLFSKSSRRVLSFSTSSNLDFPLAKAASLWIRLSSFNSFPLLVVAAGFAVVFPEDWFWSSANPGECHRDKTMVQKTT